MTLARDAFGDIGETLTVLRRGLSPFAEWAFRDRFGARWSTDEAFNLPKNPHSELVAWDVTHDEEGLLPWEGRVLLNAISGNWDSSFRYLGIGARGHLNLVIEFVRSNYAHGQKISQLRSLTRFLEHAELLLRAMVASTPLDGRRISDSSFSELKHAKGAALGAAEEIRARRVALEKPATRRTMDRTEFIDKFARHEPNPAVDLAINDGWERFYRGENPLYVKDEDDAVIFKAPATVVLDSTDGRITQFTMSKLERDFELDADIARRTLGTCEGLIDKHITMFPDDQKFRIDGRILRLARFEDQGSRLSLIVQYTKYLNYVHTNHSMDYRLEGDESDKRTLRQFLHPNGEVCGLEESKCANPLCVEILIFTSDNNLMLQKRSDRVLTFPFMYASSVSGALKADRPYTSHEAIEKIISGELYQELAMTLEDLEETTIKFLGIARDLLRGGSPLLLFVCKSFLTAEEIRTKWISAGDRDENQAMVGIPFPTSLPDGILTKDQRRRLARWARNNFVRDYVDMAAPALLANLGLWLKARLRDSESEGVS